MSRCQGNFCAAAVMGKRLFRSNLNRLYYAAKHQMFYTYALWRKLELKLKHKLGKYRKKNKNFKVKGRK